MTTETTLDTRELDAQHVLQTYKRLQIVIERGEGMRLYDDRGRAYLDFLSGIGAASLGHGHPVLARAIADQATRVIHTSNLFYHPWQSALAARLTALTGLDRVFLCNSGTEALEGCLKFARRYWHTKGESARVKFVAFAHSFHGRTMGSLSVTWNRAYREPFGPLVPHVTFVDPTQPALLAEVVDETTAAIIVEPVQGEGGVRPLSPALVEAIGAACAQSQALLICDEVQSGCGRTGRFLASQLIGLTPDLVALGKALGAGVPIGATALRQHVADTISAGDHGTTNGGNPLACRAALAFLDVLEGGLTEQIQRTSVHLAAGLRDLATKHHNRVREVRGAGLMAALDLHADSAQAVDAALTRGLIVNRTATTVIRLLPPFIVTESDIDEALQILDASLTATTETSA